MKIFVCEVVKNVGLFKEAEKMITKLLEFWEHIHC